MSGLVKLLIECWHEAATEVAKSLSTYKSEAHLVERFKNKCWVCNPTGPCLVRDSLSHPGRGCCGQAHEPK